MVSGTPRGMSNVPAIANLAALMIESPVENNRQLGHGLVREQLGLNCPAARSFLPWITKTAPVCDVVTPRLFPPVQYRFEPSNDGRHLGATEGHHDQAGTPDVLRIPACPRHRPAWRRR